MKLYYTPGACSLAVHIVLREAGLRFELEQVDLAAKTTGRSTDYRQVNALGYVPALALDDGTLLTETAAILAYLADTAPAAGPAAGREPLERYRLQRWLAFINSELHKLFSPWLFVPDAGEQAQAFARARIAERLAHVDAQLAHGHFLLGESFTVADAYLFAVARWSHLFGIDLAPNPRLAAYLERVGERPAVRAALQVEKGDVGARAQAGA